MDEWNVMLNTDGDEEPDYAIVGRDSGTVLLGGLTGNNLVAVMVVYRFNRGGTAQAQAIALR